MQYKLINPIKYDNPIIQVLTNRGISYEKIDDYIHSSYLPLKEKYVSPPEALGESKMNQGFELLMETINNNKSICVIVDPDADGNTSAALLINYLEKSFTASIDYFVHEGKQHGLNDCIEYLLSKHFDLVICPDSASNDCDECKKLQEQGTKVLILDHHDFDKENPYAIVINNQEGYSDYPNKFLSGVGVVWQFCRYIDKKLNLDNADNFLDLVAIGLTGDMMDIREIETKVLIEEGLKRITNPYLYYMAQKNAFKLGSRITPMGAAFYIVPLLNAIQRSGTLEEKKLVFESMLNSKAFEMISSNKRGHKVGEMEKRVEQAVRTSTNVKNRQTRIQDASLEKLEQKIKDENLLNHKVLLFLLDKTIDIPAEVRGLVANKFMAKYQRPCCLLTRTEEICGQTLDGYRTEVSYSGSARGCSLAGIDDFKQICVDSKSIDWAVGHPNAFGLQIPEEKLNDFLTYTDNNIKTECKEPIYQVDYLFNTQNEVSSDVILTIADMDNYWGSELNEPYIAIANLKVTPKMVQVLKSNTLKIQLENGVSLIKFGAEDEMIEKFSNNNTGYIQIDVIGKCQCNEWAGNRNAQLLIEDYNIIDSNKYYF